MKEQAQEKENFHEAIKRGVRITEKETSKEKFYLVQFNPKILDTEPDRVALCVNGEILTFSRGIPTPIPQRYKECAEHTTYTDWRQDPDSFDRKDGYRKEEIKKMRYPFTVINEITEDQYKEIKAVGDKEVSKYLKDKGLQRA